MPPAIKEHLSNIVAAHNIYVELDPVLATRDHARLGPDAKLEMIAPEEAQPIIEEAVQEGIITQEAHDAFAEEAEVAPSIADPDNRNSRRFSESVKNLNRIVFSKALEAMKWVAHESGQLSKAVGAGALGGLGGLAIFELLKVSNVTGWISGGLSVVGIFKLIQWIVRNEKWFQKHCKDQPQILKIIEFLKKGPIL